MNEFDLPLQVLNNAYPRNNERGWKDTSSSFMVVDDAGRFVMIAGGVRFSDTKAGGGGMVDITLEGAGTGFKLPLSSFERVLTEPGLTEAVGVVLMT